MTWRGGIGGHRDSLDEVTSRLTFAGLSFVPGRRCRERQASNRAEFVEHVAVDTIPIVGSFGIAIPLPAGGVQKCETSPILPARSH